MRHAKIKLVHEPEPVELRAVARVGEFVAHVPWNASAGYDKYLTISHEATSAEVLCEKARLVRAFMRGAKSGRTLARGPPLPADPPEEVPVSSLDPNETTYGKFDVTDDGTLIMGGFGISLDTVLSIAKSQGVRPHAGAEPGSAKYLIYNLRAAVIALRRKVAVADAARAVHAALCEDEQLLAAVDAAYRLGGAQAVRDLVLRGASAPKE